MDLDDGTDAQARFEEYTASLAAVLGHADRVRPFADYCVGLLSADGRKSVEPLAAVTAPERTAAQHQSLLHFVAGAVVRSGDVAPCARMCPAIHHAFKGTFTRRDVAVHCRQHRRAVGPSAHQRLVEGQPPGPGCTDANLILPTCATEDHKVPAR